MPSAGNVQIDEADAGKAIYDAPPPASLAEDDALNNDSSTNNQHQQQASVHFQEDKVTNRDLDNEFAEAMPNPPDDTAKASITISPTPKKKSKNVGASSSTKKSKGKPSTTPKKNTTSAAAVATPSSSAEKAKKKGGKKKSEPKKPSTTLLSFFGKAGPSKKSSSSNTNSSGVAKIAAVKAKLAKEAADTDAAIKISVGDEESATKDNKATTKTKTKKKPPKKTKGDNSGGVLGGDDATSTAKKSKKSTSANKKKSIAVDAPSTVVLSDNNQDEELDDAPARVVQIASRTHCAAAGGITRRNSRGSVRKGDTISASSNGVATTSLDGGDAKNEEVVIERVTTKAPAANKSDTDDKLETDDAVDNNNSPKPTVLDEVDDEDGKKKNTSADKLTSEAAVLNDVDGSADGNSDANSEDLKELGDLLESPEAASQQSPSSTSNRVSMSPEQLSVAAADTNGDEEGSNTSEMLVEITDNVEQNSLVDMDTQEDLAGDPNLLSLLGDIPDANDEAPVQEDIVNDDDATVEVDEKAVEEKTNTSVETDSIDEGVEKKDEPSVLDVPKESVVEELSAEEINTTNSTKPEESSNDEVIVIDNNPTGSTKKAAGDTTKKEKKKVKDPNAPKRNKTAYNYYSSASRNDVKTANPSAKPIEITKLISENWKALSAKEKAPWDAKAAPDKERYQKEMAEYTSKGVATKSSTSTSPKPTPSSSSKTPKKESKGMNNIATLLKQQAALSPKKKSNTPKRKSPSTTVLLSKSPAKPLSEENATRLRKYTSLREKYVTRATELGNRPTSDYFEEESLCLDGLTVDEKSVELAEDGAFPDKLLNHLQLIVQGRSLPLSDMANKALVELSPFVTDDRPLTIESISAKIKLLAERKSYLSGNPPSPSEKPSSSKLDCFENAEECYLWRWELSSIDLLPQKEATKVKKARSMRKKLQSHHKSIINLITAVDKAISWLQNSASSKSTPAAGEKLFDKIPTLEEKVLKFEREEETARLKKEAKLQEDKSKTNELEEKQHKKAEAAKEREEAKRKKTEEKERKKNEEMEQKLKADEKKKKRMFSFFNSGGAKKKQKVSSSAVTPKAVEQVETSTFDSKAFCKLIDSQDEHVCKNPFEKLSPQSKASRRRKTNKVRVSVFVTVLSENAFAPQPYDEEKVMIVNNRYKFLGFHEDVRPPYRGTWSKLSSVVTGRRPYGKDTTHLDYENDSEAEWEEGDDEEGEDLADGDDGVDEEDDMQNEEDNDGWLAAEDDLGIEDDDDDTIALRKKNLSEKNASATKPSLFKACVIAPRIGGLSHESFNDDDMQCVIEGFTPKDAMDALTSHVGCIITPDVGVCLDAFPPVAYSKDTAQTNASGKSTTRQNKAMSPDAKKTMAQFVHNTTYKSKDVLLTELLSAHPNIANSRAHAKQELDVLADKLNNPHATGSIWEVKEDLLKKLGLKKKDLKKAPAPPKEAKEAKVKDPNAPKRNKTAYNYYSSATRNDVKTANPNATSQAPILGENWKALSAEEKAPWDAKAAADKERYQKEMAEYTSKGGAATSSSPKPTPSSSSKSPKKGATEMKGMNIITSLQKQAELSPKAAAATTASSSAKADESQSKKPSSAMKKRKEPASSFTMFANFVAKAKKQKTT